MKTYIEPNRSDWSEITTRPVLDHLSLVSKVSEVLTSIKKKGMLPSVNIPWLLMVYN